MGLLIRALAVLLPAILKLAKVSRKSGLNALKKAKNVFSKQRPCSVQSCQSLIQRSVKFSDTQLQSKYKHAKDFGINGNYNKENVAKFKEVVEKHVHSDSTSRIEGVFTRGVEPQKVIHYVDKKTGLNVMTDANGNFISAWKLQPQQLQNVITTGRLGGG